MYADAGLYLKFASVGAREKGDDDMAASGKLTQDEIGFDACRRMSNFHRDTYLDRHHCTFAVMERKTAEILQRNMHRKKYLCLQI